MSRNPGSNGADHDVAGMPPPLRDLPAGRHEHHKEHLMTLIDQDNRTTDAAPVVLRPRFVLPVIAAAAVAAVVPSFLPGPIDRAVASWTPRADEIVGVRVLPQANACAHEEGAGSAEASDVLVAQRRGVTTAMIIKIGNGLWECLVSGEDHVFGWQALTDGPMPALATGTVTAETWSSRGEGDNQISNLVGRAGSGVTGIDVVLDNGTKLQTMSGGGWWTAWWPGPEGGEVDTFSIVVHTAAGIRTYRPEQLHDGS
jgi:hypothetical protein